MFALMHGDLSRAAQNAAELARLTREHDLPMWRAFGVFLEGFATAQSSSAGGLDAMRDGAELLWAGFRAILSDAQWVRHGGNAQARCNPGGRRCRL